MTPCCLRDCLNGIRPHLLEALHTVLADMSECEKRKYIEGMLRSSRVATTQSMRFRYHLDHFGYVCSNAFAVLLEVGPGELSLIKKHLDDTVPVVSAAAVERFREELAVIAGVQQVPRMRFFVTPDVFRQLWLLKRTAGFAYADFKRLAERADLKLTET